jgi:tRNA1Val (adenine37-N6)-methyltransferase
MANAYFQFKQFTIQQDRCAMKVTTDGCLFGAWCAGELARMQAGEKRNTSIKALDIGTGTGLLSLMVAQKNPALIDAVEIEEGAAEQAFNNTAGSPFKERIKVHQGDILLLKKKQYNVIFSNPPFYENELKSGNKVKDTAHHSHLLTWADLFAAINRLLALDGIFFLLLPFKRYAELEGYVRREQLFINKVVRVQQTTRHEPFRVMVQGSRAASTFMETELAIRDEHQQYTTAYVALLKDYYLYL